MEWILVIGGLLLGALFGSAIGDSAMGAVVGLGIALAIIAGRVQEAQRRLQRDLEAFIKRFDHGTGVMHQRVLTLERHASGAPAPAAADETLAEPVPLADAAAEVAEPAPAERQVAPTPAAALSNEALQAALDLPGSAPAEVAQPETSEPALLEIAPSVEAEATTPLAVEPIEIDAAASEVSAAESAPAEAKPSISAPAAKPAAPVVPRVPAQPDIFERAYNAARDWLLGGNTVLRIGVVLLFLGLAFLLRYATEGMVMPPQAPYLGTAAAALALLGLGWWLRGRRAGYALILQGTGVAVLYLTVFAGIKLYPELNDGAILIPASAGFVLLVLVSVFAAVLAVLQDARGMAAAAALGGFATPILASTGGGNHVALFSYFALLNAGIFAIAWFKAWRVLNLIGFVGTFGIGFAWGLRGYRPELFASTEPFLILFFLMYLAIGLLFARRKLREAGDAPAEGDRQALLHWSLRQGDYLDGTVLFGTPLIGFGLQYAVIRHLEFGAAFSALALGLIYLGLARLLSGRRVLLLMEACLALGVVFASLAIPLGLDARWTSAAWAVEGAGIYWLGLRQRRPVARGFALLLQLGAMLAFLGDLRSGTDTVLDGAPLGALMLGVALLFGWWQARRQRDALADWEPGVQPWLAGLGLGFVYLIAALCLGVTGTAIAWALAGLATVFAGLRLGSRTFLGCAFAVQLLGGALFLLNLDGAGLGSGAGLGDGWRDLLTASLVGLALIGGMVCAARDDKVRADKALLTGLSVVLLAGLVLINLAVLFVLPWRVASAVWGGSGLLIAWLCLGLRQRVGFVFGLVLQGVGGLSFLLLGPALFGPADPALAPLAHAGFWTPAVLSLAALVGAWRLHRAAVREEAAPLGAATLQPLATVLLYWGVGWWALTALGEVVRFVEPALRDHLLLAVAAFSVLAWQWLARRERWHALALVCVALPVLGLPVLLLGLEAGDYLPLADWGWLAWPALALAHWTALRRLDDLLPARLVRVGHLVGCWLLLWVAAQELRMLLALLAEHDNAWRWLGWMLVPSAFLALMAGTRRLPWPVAAYPATYRIEAALPVAALTLLWFWLANLFSDGAAAPLPYLPLLNPLELGALIALAATYRWADYALASQAAPRPVWRRALLAVAGASVLLLLTQAVCRTVHHWSGVPFEQVALLGSMQVQAGWSIVWTLCALALMVFGHRRVDRELWMVGAALIGVVVVKLFFVELGNRGGLERIVSFIGVGVLLLIVGYFSPLPPRRAPAVPEPEQP
ncbi:hypothetical protein GCM10007860_28650 [Chitiniphilus shinanonensis]|uniref:DUF2339 domain-containing protein n=1 Tax=Chitiniphilus shinanonensis TaxID=553088 RepID=A0ABQ6BUP0_9NEIS|nr:DUF2339 domain-containing protein [Chitiniphilus shinanonensis]GLS05708.1 hypothetical protein GCM10007860_28650 [Chitiniphilus shinanonensis]